MTDAILVRFPKKVAPLPLGQDSHTHIARRANECIQAEVLPDPTVPEWHAAHQVP